MTALKQAVGAKGSQILGFGAARGDLVVPNSELVEAIDSSDEWIRQRTGIITRKRASKGINAIDLAEIAGREAIEKAGVTGIIELAPAGALVGLAKRALKGVPTVAVKTPDDLAAAHALIDSDGAAA